MKNFLSKAIYILVGIVCLLSISVFLSTPTAFEKSIAILHTILAILMARINYLTDKKIF